MMRFNINLRLIYFKFKNYKYKLIYNFYNSKLFNKIYYINNKNNFDILKFEYKMLYIIKL
jgi:hypothetical protein